MFGCNQGEIQLTTVSYPLGIISKRTDHVNNAGCILLAGVSWLTSADPATGVLGAIPRLS